MKTKRETYALLEQIYLYYEQFQVNQEKINSWHEALKEFSYEELHTNLLKFVRYSNFPPKISDLIQASDKLSRAIPDTKETQTQFIYRPLPVSEEVVRAERANMRKILGIQRGNEHV